MKKCFDYQTISHLMMATTLMTQMPHMVSCQQQGICAILNCGNGNCSIMKQPPFYECKCNSEWANLLNLPSLPCLAPDCSILNVCSPTSAPSYGIMQSGFPLHFNVCEYPICGHGECKESSKDLLYECICDAGYTNFLNVSTGYCFEECELEEDCQIPWAPPGDENQDMIPIYENGQSSIKTKHWLQLIIQTYLVNTILDLVVVHVDL